jgi:hypothetical protein
MAGAEVEVLDAVTFSFEVLLVHEQWIKPTFTSMNAAIN